MYPAWFAATGHRILPTFAFCTTLLLTTQSLWADIARPLRLNPQTSMDGIWIIVFGVVFAAAVALGGFMLARRLDKKEEFLDN